VSGTPPNPSSISEIKELCGVWYTPETVVNFIVRAIDEVLKTHFDLKDGIADKSKIKIAIEDQAFDKRTKTGKAKKEVEVHKVQLLDVATGTGKFLAEAVKQIYKRYKGQEGIWSSYVEHDLLPRLHGFELLMASYAMCHMKLDLLLQETGYKTSNTTSPPRLSVYLTNSLEEHHPEMDTLFASWLSREANDASWIKKNMPIMVAFGNPPYNGQSKNKGKWITDEMGSYKKEPGGKIKLQERNPKWINNDYVKFIRMGETYIEKYKKGILAYITSNSYLDNPTFRGMRWHLLRTFDDIYILDLHGNSNVAEDIPEGKRDENVFDIRESVSIIVAVKKSHAKKNGVLANLYHHDVWGSRLEKHEVLEHNSLESFPWKKLKYQEPYYYFLPSHSKGLKLYNEGFNLDDLVIKNSTGYYTSCDEHVIGFSTSDLEAKIVDFLPDDKVFDGDLIRDTTFRPFDNRKIYFDPSILTRSRKKFVESISCVRNTFLILGKSTKSKEMNHFFISNFFSELKCAEYSKGSYIFPLYVHAPSFEDETHKVSNLDQNIFNRIKKIIPNVTPETLFDYIYAVLHCPSYRNRYAEFLKSNFPRIPYPDDPAMFNVLAKKGAGLRSLHLMESDTLDDLITTYPEAGDNEVQTISKNSYRDGKVWINESQYFSNVPELAWNFYIGGYQPAQKWLKDRKGRTLSVDDIMHYQRIILALTETDRIMKEIDEIDIIQKGKSKS